MSLYVKNKLLTICFISVLFLRGTSQTNNTDIKILDSTFIKLDKTRKLDSLAKFAHDKSIAYYKKKDYKNAIKFAKIEVDFGFKVLDSSTYKNALRNLGLFYYRNDNYYKSIATYQKVIDSFNKDKKTLQAYCELGRNYRRLGDFHQALLYFEKGISEPKYFSGSELANNYSYLLDLYDSYDTNIKGFLNRKLELLKKVDSINESINADDYKIVDNEISFGDYYSNEEILDVVKAKHHFEKALILATKTKDTFGIVLSNNKLGYLYNLIKNDSSFIYIKKGIQLSTDDNPILTNLYTNLGEYYYNKGDLNEALKANQKELSLLLPESIEENYEYTPSFKNLALSKDKTHTVFTLKNKAFYFLEKYKLTKQKKDLNTAHKILISADQLLDTIKKESIATNTKLFWQQEASLIYMMAVKTCFLLNNTSSAFYFMEKKKAVLLLENLSDKQVRERINLPDSIFEKELSIKQSLSKIENEIHYAEKKKIDSLTSLHNDLKISHSNFLKSLQKKYQTYYESRIPTKIISLSTFQKTLNNETLILEYVLDKTDGYMLSISKSKVEMFNLENTKDLITKVNSFNELNSKPFNTTKNKLDYNNLANKLYNRLIPKNTISKSKQVIIIPDYNLQFLSFEVLKPTKNNDDYLIKNHEISYAYSLTFLNKNNSINRKTETDIVAFAPIKFNNGLSQLKSTSYEIDKLKDLLNGNYYLDTLATKQRFIENINNSKIIHLATHASANDSVSPWIALEDEKLYLNELYNTQNNAELVTLSACNTATGQIKQGEGVFSLARGFFFSGANSVASTLWKVDDKSTTIIIEEFYKNLKKGQTKSEALRNSKLNYLKTNSLSETSPYYWASLVLIGDAGKIEINNNVSVFYFYIIGFVLLLIIAYFLIKKK